jgi:hypothetical protein
MILQHGVKTPEFRNTLVYAQPREREKDIKGARTMRIKAREHCGILADRRESGTSNGRCIMHRNLNLLGFPMPPSPSSRPFTCEMPHKKLPPSLLPPPPRNSPSARPPRPHTRSLSLSTSMRAANFCSRVSPLLPLRRFLALPHPYGRPLLMRTYRCALYAKPKARARDERADD